MIEWRWNLRPLTIRDSTANNLAEALDFSRPNLTAPLFNVPPGPFGTVCPSSIPGVDALSDFAAGFGFNIL
jgi:phospholipase C